jgi:hypothetical protein
VNEYLAISTGGALLGPTWAMAPLALAHEYTAAHRKSACHCMHMQLIHSSLVVLCLLATTLADEWIVALASMQMQICVHNLFFFDMVFSCSLQPT